MHFRGDELVAVLTGTSFAAGLNVYATVGTLGLLSRAGWVTLPPALHPLSSWWVIAASLVLFLVELFADKIPAFDLLWNALHTFIRIPVAALLAYQATAQLPPHVQILSSLLAAGIATAAHGGKTALRAVVTPSPEPVSNSLLSVAEDGIAIGLTWLALRHPYVTAVLVAILVIGILLVCRWIFRALRNLFGAAGRRLQKARPSGV